MTRLSKKRSKKEQTKMSGKKGSWGPSPLPCGSLMGTKAKGRKKKEKNHGGGKMVGGYWSPNWASRAHHRIGAKEEVTKKHSGGKNVRINPK